MKIDIDVDDEILESIKHAGYRPARVGHAKQGELYWVLNNCEPVLWEMEDESYEPRLIVEPACVEREPTQDDLANGPIKCWVRDDETQAWNERELVGIIPESMGPEERFECRDPEMPCFFGPWKHCKIRVPVEKKLRIEMGKWYMARDGKGPFKVVGFNCRDINGVEICVSEDGRRLCDDQSPLNLVEEVPAPTKRVTPTLQMLADAGGEMDCWVRDNYCDDWLHCTLVAVAPSCPRHFGTLDDGGPLYWWRFAEVEVPCE